MVEASLGTTQSMRAVDDVVAVASSTTSPSERGAAAAARPMSGMNASAAQSQRTTKGRVALASVIA